MRKAFDKLDNYESRFSGDVWNNINGVLVAERQKKKRRNIIAFTSLVLLLISTSSYLYFNGYEDLSFDRESNIQQASILPSSNTMLDNDHTYKLEDTKPSKDSRVVPSGQPLSVYQVSSNIKNSDHEQLSITSEVYLDTQSQEGSEQVDVYAIPFDETHSSQVLALNSSFAKLNTVNELESIAPHITESKSVGLKFNLTNIFNHGDCPAFGNANYRLYAWSHISGVLPLAQFSAKNTSNQQYESARQTTEAGLISSEAAIGLGMVFKKGYYVEAGLQYAHWREKFSYIDPESISYQTIITIDTVFQAMDTIITIDTSRTEIPGSREIVNYNAHKSYNIPVVFGYQKTINNILSYSLKAGAIFNIQLESKGRILDHNMIAKNISANEAGFMDVYKPKLSTQIILGGQLNYHLTPEVHAYVSPQVRFTQSSVTNDSYLLKQTYVNPSVSIGLKYFL